ITGLSIASVLRWILVGLLGFVGFLNLRGPEIWDTYVAYAGASAAYVALVSPLFSIVAAVMLALRQKWAVFALLVHLALMGWRSREAEFVPFGLIIIDVLVIAFCIREWLKGRLSVAPRASSSEARPPHRAWWAYFVLVVALATVWFFLAVPRVQFWPIAVPSAILGVAGIVGLWCYLRSKPLGPRGFWEVYLSLEISRFLAGAWFSLNNAALSAEPGVERMVAFALIGGELFGVPLLVAIWLYVYRSPAIWQTPRS